MPDKNPLDKLKKILKIDGKNKKVYSNIIVLFLVGILLVIVSSFFKNAKPMLNINNTSNDTKIEKQKNSNKKQVVKSNYEVQLEKKLKNTLENIQGVGKVQVMIYFGCGEQQVPVYDANDSNSVTEESDNGGGKRKTTQNTNGDKVVMKNEGDKKEPFITKIYKPKITGVCVVAEGAKEDLTKLTITKAVVDLFDLPQNKVNVYPMN